MARLISFFPKQTLVGNYTTEGAHFSEVFEVTDADQVTVRLQVAANTFTGAITGILQESADPAAPDSQWQQVGSVAVNQTGNAKATYSGLKRFVRGVVTVVSGSAATVSFEGISRGT